MKNTYWSTLSEIEQGTLRKMAENRVQLVRTSKIAARAACGPNAAHRLQCLYGPSTPRAMRNGVLPVARFPLGVVKITVAPKNLPDWMN